MALRVVSFSGVVAETFTGTSVTHTSAGVTYTFANTVEYGFYWNGDPFVVSNGGDITITSITPEWSGVGDVIHGTMLQPNGTQPNGFDSRVTWAETVYVAATNVDPAKTGVDLVVSAATYPQGASVVKAVSLTNLGLQQDRSFIDKFSVLTVVPSTPRANAFRPAVMARNKTAFYTLDDLDFSVLKTVSPVLGQMAIDNPLLTMLKEATFVSWYPGSESVRYFHPNSYHEGYNDYQLDRVIIPALMALHSTYTNEQKRDLYASIVQQGIDYAAFNNDQGIWPSITTHVELFPPIIALTAAALGQPQEILNAMAVPRVESFFYVPAEYVGQDGFDFTSSFVPSFATYQSVQVGMPEWRVNADVRDVALRVSYRGIVSDNVPIVALLMDMVGNGLGRSLIDYPAFFDYAERMRLIFAVNQDALTNHSPTNEWQAFGNAYHATYWTGSPVSLRPEQPVVGTVGASGSNISVDIDWVYPGSASVSQIDVRYKVAGGSWTTISDFGTSGTITGLSAGLYFVQARAINSVGEGPWSDNEINTNNTSVLNALIAEGIVTQGEVDAAGGAGIYRQTQAYEDHVRSIWDGSPGYEALTLSLVRSTVEVV